MRSFCVYYCVITKSLQWCCSILCRLCYKV